MKVWHYSLLLFVTTLMGCFLVNDAQIDPSFGFVEVMLNETSFEYQKPYDTPLELQANGTRRFWVYADDKPHHLGSNTQPRTEIRIHLDYTSGIWQFEGMVFVPNGTSGATIVQIHGAAHGNTTILLRIYDGDMRYYSTPVIDIGL
ncbi:putative concanavalin A-like lectin/glucanase domain superfamily [Helianthus debilis subsp. tardiflorus]